MSLWDAVFGIIFLLVVGFLSGRILGVRRGAVRSLVAGVLGSLIGVTVAGVVVEHARTARAIADLDIADFGFALLATMVMSIVLEVLLRPRRDRKRLSTRARLRAAVTVGGRLWEVSRIARRHGLAGRRVVSRNTAATPETALRVRLFLEDCGGIFVKFGQIASTRSDLLSAPMVAELAELQSSVRPIPVDDVLEQIHRTLDAPVAQTFARFDREPLAAASIGQTHTAVLPDGRPVVVKVRRPDVEVGLARDAAVLRWATRVVSRRSAAARTLGLERLAQELVQSVESELDFVHEAANGRALRAVPAPDGVSVPAVVTELTSEAVLVLERVDGRPLSDTAAVDATPVARPVLADRLFQSFLTQMLQAGVFHADPHPGNILIDRAGTLWFIDFGAVGILDPITLEAVHLMGAGIGTGEPALVARALRSLAGPAGESLDLQAVTVELSQLLSEQLHGGGFDPRSLQRIIELMGRHGIPVPPALTVLARALLTLEGTLRVLDSRFQLAGAAAAHLRGALDVSAGSLRSVLEREAMRTLPSLRALPGLVEDIALQVRSGRLAVQVDPLSATARHAATQWVDGMLFAAVAAVGLLSSTAMLVGAVFAGDRSGVGVLQAVGYIGLVLSSVMLMRVVAQILRRRDEPPPAR
ncbi:ABC1 kinase family protein [Nakamurella endophytica]|uniref:Ubiquinone biosynthesis protein UbiB n=1 Tax=Nakamurella endophytica TaxID=1748367 RepID=A0A917T8Y4_9ACTN|nr:AarF/UbiB family protein [Nakamurella endophytica]GGM14839.1 ubiquinone biosynthesis protein UbiB [Nakamurella endophytica]